MKKTFLFIVAVLSFSFGLRAQDKIDSTAKPEEVTNLDVPANTVISPGYLLRTRSKNYYEISGKKSYKTSTPSPEVKAYKIKKRKYLLDIHGIPDAVAANKVSDVTESKIDGDFRGWDGTTSFKLMNGDTWLQDEIKSKFSPAIYRPTVYIYPSSDGSYKMKVEGVDELLQVKKK